MDSRSSTESESSSSASVTPNPATCSIESESSSWASVTPNPATCSICLEGLGFCGLLIRCGHIFHEHCLLRWFREGYVTCPECREHYTIQDVFDIAATAHRHRVYAYDRLGDCVLPGDCRCITCRHPITDVFKLFMPSGLCRHWFHVECAQEYFLKGHNKPWREIETMLVETDYCPSCVQTLDLSTFKRLEDLCKLILCRNQCVM